MTIAVAGAQKTVPDGLTLAGLIEREQVETPQYVTVSLNEDFVEQGAFGGTVLREGDAVEFLYFMGGGCGSPLRARKKTRSRCACSRMDGVSAARTEGGPC
jgi:sulfur carrier protein